MVSKAAEKSRRRQRQETGAEVEMAEISCTRKWDMEMLTLQFLTIWSLWLLQTFHFWCGLCICEDILFNTFFKVQVSSWVEGGTSSHVQSSLGHMDLPRKSNPSDWPLLLAIIESPNGRWWIPVKTMGIWRLKGGGCRTIPPWTIPPGQFPLPFWVGHFPPRTIPPNILCIHTHTCMHTHTYTYIHTYIHTHIHIHTYIYTYTYIHTHTYIYTHTYTCIHTVSAVWSRHCGFNDCEHGAVCQPCMEIYWLGSTHVSVPITGDA